MGAVDVPSSSLMHRWHRRGVFLTRRRITQRRFFHAVSSSAVDTVAPQLWAYEKRNCVLMAIRRGRISQPDGEQFLVSMNELNVRLSEPASYDEVFSLAQRHGLTVYDAAYLDVAIREQLPMATLDHQLVRAAQKAGVVLFQP